MKMSDSLWKDLVKDLKISKQIDIEKTFTEIIEYLADCEKRVETAEKKVTDWNKDTEITKLRNEIEQLKNKPNNNYMSFVVTRKEAEQIQEWKDQHIQTDHAGESYSGAIGGRYTYLFTPTSIGEIGEVKCSCGKSFCFREI